jgi:CCR4-NOT transcription complex subunit 6
VLLLTGARFRYMLVEKISVDYRQIGMQRQAIKSEDLFNRVAHRDHIAVVCLFEHRESGSRVIVANTHIFWDPAYRDIKLVQVALLLEELETIAQNFSRLPPRLPAGAAPGSRRAAPAYTDGARIPLVIAIDANSGIDSGVYELLSTGKVEPTHPDFMTHLYGAYTVEGIRHKLNLKSAYAAAGGELPMTNHTSNFKGVIDYIFFSTQSLNVTAVLGEIDKGYLDKVVGFPNAHFPSE